MVARGGCGVWVLVSDIDRTERLWLGHIMYTLNSSLRTTQVANIQVENNVVIRKLCNS